MPPGSSAAEISDASKDLVANVALKAGYLNLTGWICRGGIYFAIFFGLSILLNKWSKMEDESDDPIYRHMLTNLSGGGLLIFLVITTFAGIDWVMSLEPIWYSSLFGAVILVGQGHSTLCLMVVLLRYLVGDSPLLMKYERRYVRDIGNLMLAFTLLWAYVSYDQWLIQYSGNLAGEAPWFIHRTTGGWQYFGALVIILHFALPFLFLLMSLMKVNLSNLAKLAGFLLFVRLSDLFFYVAPTFQLTRSTPFAGFGNMAFLADFGVPLALIGIWLWAWTYEMVKVNAPVVPVFDGRLDPEFSYEPLQAKEAGAHV